MKLFSQYGDSKMHGYVEVFVSAISKLKYYRWAVVVVKWSACLPSSPTIRVRIPLKSIIFLEKLLLKRTKINKKESGVGPILKQKSTVGRRCWPRKLESVNWMKRGFCHCWQILLVCKGTSFFICWPHNTRLLIMSMDTDKRVAIDIMATLYFGVGKWIS